MALWKLGTVALTLTLATPAWGQARHALVVGNGAYRDIERLDNPVADASAVASALEGVGFEVTVVTNAGLKAFEGAVERFVDVLDQSGPDSVGLFYFAGHGLQIDGMNWLIPVDAEISRAANVKYEAVSAQEVLDLMGEARNNTDILVLDACRNNPYRTRFSTTGTRSIRGGLAEMSAPQGAFLVYSTAPGAVAFDGTGALSPFAEAFTTELATPGVSIGDMMVSVRRSVRDATAVSGAPQVPWTASSLMGRFVFVPSGAGEPARGLETIDEADLRPPPVGPEAMTTPLSEAEPLNPCSDQVRARRRTGRIVGAVMAGVGAAAFGTRLALEGGLDTDSADDALWIGGAALAVGGVGVIVPSSIPPRSCTL